MLQLEQEKAAHDRQLEGSRKQFEAEITKRKQLEQLVSRQKTELIQLRDHTAKYDREINKVLSELKSREWEVKQLESKQDKTIVEHVHVLEEAKRVTDRQLVEAQQELQKNVAYIRSLEKSKTRLTGEAEDLARETERERVELRAKEKVVKAQEDRAAKAIADITKEQ
jgi:myosin heavy chain 9/10/11/14